MDKNFIAKGVAERIISTEQAIDAAVAEASALLSETISAGHQLNASPALTNKAIAKLSEAITALSTARTATLQSHLELAAAADVLEIRTQAGPFTDTWQTMRAMARARSEAREVVGLRQAG